MAKHNQWIKVGNIDDIPKAGARKILTGKGDIGVYRTSDDEVFALLDKCPHKDGPLSQGIVHGRTIACPLHDMQIDLTTGRAIAPDTGCVDTFQVKVKEGMIYLKL